MTSRQKRSAIILLKSLGVCVDCGHSYESYCMEFDHVNGDKFANVSDMINRSQWNDILTEIAKCELVCVLCHRIRTNTLRKAINEKRWANRAKFLSDIKYDNNVTWVAELKKAPCADCGMTYKACQMDFDHKIGTHKKKSIAHLLREGDRRAIIKEMEKCDLVCALCHKRRTYAKDSSALTVSRAQQKLSLSQQYEAIDLYRSGMTMKAIGIRQGVSEDVIRLSLRRHGISTRNRPVRAVVDNFGNIYRNQSEAARITGISRRKIGHILGGALPSADGYVFRLE